MIIISVIIPCRNEVNYINECIDAIYSSSLIDDVKINTIVVDGLSDDGTRELLFNLKLKYSDLHIVDNKMQLTPFAFNIGIRYKKADYFQIVGARQILSPNYIQKSIEVFKKDPSILCVGGFVRNVYLNYTGQVIAKAMSTSFGMGFGNFRTMKKSGYTDTVGTPMYPSTVFNEIGHFDQNLFRNQDDDFNFRLIRNGGKIWFESLIHVKYYVRGSFKNLFKQFFQYGYWKVFVNKKHKSITTLRQLVPPLFVLFVILYLSIRILTIFSKLLLFTVVVSDIVLIIYFILVLYYSAVSSKSVKDFFYSLVTFLILHFSYGSGYLYGILQFLVLKRKPSNSQSQLTR